MAGRASPRIRIALTSAALLAGCYEGIDTDDLFADDGFGEREGDTTGDEAQDSSGDDGDGDGHSPFLTKSLGEGADGHCQCGAAFRRGPLY